MYEYVRYIMYLLWVELLFSLIGLRHTNYECYTVYEYVHFYEVYTIVHVYFW